MYTSPVIIDFHVHVFSPNIRQKREDYLRKDACFRSLYSNPKAKLATAEELIAAMDEAGVDISVIHNLGWISHQLCTETNDYILESIARYPRRLIGFCTIQPNAGEVAIAEAERCARSGAKGIGELRPDDQGFDLGDKELLQPLVDTCQKHNLILLAHASEPVGHLYPGKGEVYPQILYRFVLSFPHQPVVFAHWGGGLPFYGLMPEVGCNLANAWFDTAASPFLYRPSIFKHVGEIVGFDKILFGTDYPLMSQQRLINDIRRLDVLDKEKILGDNARMLLGLEQRDDRQG